MGGGGSMERVSLLKTLADGPQRQHTHTHTHTQGKRTNVCEGGHTTDGVAGLKLEESGPQLGIRHATCVVNVIEAREAVRFPAAWYTTNKDGKEIKG